MFGGAGLNVLQYFLLRFRPTRERAVRGRVLVTVSNVVGLSDQSADTRVFSVQYACPRDPEREKIKDHFMTCAKKTSRRKLRGRGTKEGRASVALVDLLHIQQHKFTISHG